MPCKLYYNNIHFLQFIPFTSNKFVLSEWNGIVWPQNSRLSKWHYLQVNSSLEQGCIITPLNYNEVMGKPNVKSEGMATKAVSIPWGWKSKYSIVTVMFSTQHHHQFLKPPIWWWWVGINDLHHPQSFVKSIVQLSVHTSDVTFIFILFITGQPVLSVTTDRPLSK